MIYFLLVITFLTAQSVRADLTLDRVERTISGAGLHRRLKTDITYTATLGADLRECSFVFRENITADMYIYYEEVTKGMRDFEQFPHHKHMNIEAPASTSEPQEFIWRLPLNKRHGEHTSYIKHFTSTAPDLQTVP